MQDIPSDPRKHFAQEPFSFPTDTETPPIPIFHMHSGAHPFCSRPGCLCMKNNKQLETLLHSVIGRELKLREVSNGTIRWGETNGN
jgi:hypothetical protein